MESLPPSSVSIHLDPPLHTSPRLPISHSMTTRSKNGLSKPKVPFTLTVVKSNSPLAQTEPTSFSEAIKHPIWQKAMAEEFQALAKQGT